MPDPQGFPKLYLPKTLHGSVIGYSLDVGNWKEYVFCPRNISDIVQITRVFHTGADPMERMSLRAEFDGAVLKGAQYILVDDVTNMGGTLAELANFLLEKGGLVSAVVVLVNAGRVKHFHPARTIIKKLEERFNHEIEEIFGITPSALTANEANYFVGFKTADEIRNRLAKAREETCLRLRSKGIKQ
jgi:predicted amidophosphoribosyltransferase